MNRVEVDPYANEARARAPSLIARGLQACSALHGAVLSGTLGGLLLIDHLDGLGAVALLVLILAGFLVAWYHTSGVRARRPGYAGWTARLATTLAVALALISVPAVFVGIALSAVGAATGHASAWSGIAMIAAGVGCIALWIGAGYLLVLTLARRRGHTG